MGDKSAGRTDPSSDHLAQDNKSRSLIIWRHNNIMIGSEGLTKVIGLVTNGI